MYKMHYNELYKNSTACVSEQYSKELKKRSNLFSLMKKPAK